MTNVNASMSKYQNFMQEISYRTKVISTTVQKLKTGRTSTGFRETDIELIFYNFDIVSNL